MDYPNRARIKLWGTAEVIYDDIDLINSLHDSTYKAKPERAIVFTVAAWDVNCPQHIKPRFSEEEIQKQMKPLHQKIKDLEEQVKQFKKNI